jgi:RHS repeat-associated protein
VDTQNRTGYAQVVYESTTGSTALNYEQSHTFTYGLELVNEARSYVVNGQSANSMIYFVYDGHGSARALTDTTGAVTDTYDYDAFGNLTHSTGTTYNNYLFAAEQFDPDLHLYYNRARYLNTSTGRFWSMDTFDGDPQSPTSLHKYLYAGADPVNRHDPSGRWDIGEALTAAYVYVTNALASFGPALSVVSIVSQVTALALVAADAAGYLTMIEACLPPILPAEAIQRQKLV